jgi:hypothetical protein
METETGTSEPVLYRWTDAESGEELCILVQGPPAFLAELRADGFRPIDRDDSSDRDAGSNAKSRCIVA